MLDLRLDLTGAFDTTFGTGGSVQSNFPSSATHASQAMAVKPDGSGRIVTAGFAYAGHKQNAGVARMSGADGSRDATFEGSSGAGAGLVSFPASAAYPDAVRAIAFQGDGGIILAGVSAVSGSAYGGFIARLKP